MIPHRRPVQRGAWAFAPMIAATAAALCVGGCASGPSRDSDALPSLRDIRSRHRTAPPPADIAPSEQVRRTPLRVERVDFPLDASLEDAWALLDSSGLSPAIGGAWRVNGMRAGVLKASVAPAFAQELPPAIGGKAQILVPTAAPMPLMRSPLLDAPVAVDLTIPPRPIREIVLSHGGGRRIQLLVEVVRDAMNRPVLILTPHHFEPQQTIEVRSAQQKQLDGRMLDELSLAVLLEAGEALVVGVEAPTPLFGPEPPTVVPPASEGPQQAKPLPPASVVDGADDNDDERAPPHEPEDATLAPIPPEHRLGPNLGRALLAASRYGHPIQMIYIIRIAQ